MVTRRRRVLQRGQHWSQGNGMEQVFSVVSNAHEETAWNKRLQRGQQRSQGNSMEHQASAWSAMLARKQHGTTGFSVVVNARKETAWNSSRNLTSDVKKESTLAHSSNLTSGVNNEREEKNVLVVSTSWHHADVCEAARRISSRPAGVWVAEEISCNFKFTVPNSCSHRMLDIIKILGAGKPT